MQISWCFLRVEGAGAEGKYRRVVDVESGRGGGVLDLGIYVAHTWYIH
jgi:hypothetical protein